MKKIIKKILGLLLFVFVACTALITFFTTTTPGLNILIRLSAVYFHQSIHMKGLKGRLWDQTQVAELNYHYDDMQVTIKNARLTWKFNALLHHELPIEEFHAENVQIKLKDKVFNLNEFALKAFINQQTATLGLVRFDYFNHKILGQLQIQTHAPYSFTTTLQFNPMDEHKEFSGVLNAAGDLDLIHWTGDFHGLGAVSLEGHLSHLKQLEQTIKWRELHWPVSTEQTLLSKEGRMQLSGDLPKLNIQLSSKMNNNPQTPWQVNGSLNGVLPWVWDFNLNVIQSADKTAKQPGLYTDFAITGALSNEHQGHLKIKMAPGLVLLPPESALSSLAFQGGMFTAQLSPEGLMGTGLLSLDDSKKFNVDFKLPHFDLQQGINKNQTFTSNVTLLLNSFDFLSTLTPAIKNPRGSLMLSLKAKGTFKKPVVETKIELDKASVEVPALGLHLNAIHATMNGIKDRWEGVATINSDNKTLHLAGHGLIAPQFTSDITLEGTDVPVLNTNEFKINTTPKLRLLYMQDLLHITGSIQVPEAHIKIQSFSNSVSLSNDVVFKNQKPAFTSPVRTQMDVQVEMGDQVELNAKGLHATLTGTVNVKQLPQSSMSATGELNVVEGEYKAYGQNLSIDQGELFFTGGAIDNPGINVRASKNIDSSSTTVAANNQLLDLNDSNTQNANLRGNISVGVEVTGRLTEPDIQLFSTPAILSQADILSMLVLGRPASQANKAGGQLLLAAISSMNLGNGTKGIQLLEQLKDSLGIDFNVETNSNYNLLTNTVSDKTAFVVSKSLSKRISIGYNVGLSQADPNVVTLKYLLNKFFSIQVNTSSTNSGIDVLYTSSKK